MATANATDGGEQPVAGLCLALDDEEAERRGAARQVENGGVLEARG